MSCMLALRRCNSTTLHWQARGQVHWRSDREQLSSGLATPRTIVAVVLAGACKDAMGFHWPFDQHLRSLLDRDSQP